MTKQEVEEAINTLQARIPNDQNQLLMLRGYLQRINEEEEADNAKPDLKVADSGKK